VAALWLSGATQAQTDVNAIRSPALARLAASLPKKGATALTEFWQSIEKRQGTLIEDLPNSSNALYTLVWRSHSNDPANAVRLAANVTQRNRGGIARLQHLPNSDVWYASYELPRRATIGYAFVVPASSEPKAEVIGYSERDGVKFGMYRDPFNSRTVDAIGAKVSFVAGPDAKFSPYLEEFKGSDVGSMKTLEMGSESLAGSRRVDVYTPAGYEKTKTPLPFVLLFDGDEYQRSIPTPRILDNLIAQKKIPPVVVAFFHSPNRDRDLLPGPAFQTFLSQELLPELRRRYRISADPSKNVVAGYSLGGLAAVYAASKHPALFGNVICQSGSLWWGAGFFDAPDYVQGQYLNSHSGDLIKTFAESKPMPIRFYLEAGEWEEAGALLPSRLLLSVLKGKGYRVQYQEFLGAHDSFSWKETLPEALIYTLN
jgi:enterochelin esterase family protein